LGVATLSGIIIILSIHLSNTLKHSNEINTKELQQVRFRHICSFLDIYYLDHNAFPNSSDELAIMIARDEKLDSFKFVDAWGTRMKYEKSKHGVKIISAGPDKYFGTFDDIETNILAAVGSVQQ
jgi:hypothetical protein